MSRSGSRGVTAVFGAAIAAVVAVLASVGVYAWSKLARTVPVTFTDPAEQFKYGSIGNMEKQGMPYYIWLVLPRVFGEYLPGNGGYASLGFPTEQGHEIPVGFARQTIGFPRIAFNCALCHAASYRTSPNAPPTIVPAGPGHTQNTQAYLQFLFNSAADPRFNADVLLPEIKQNFALSAADELLYRHLLIPATRQALLEQREASSWMKVRPKWGPGRIDPFNPVKFGMLGLKVDDTLGNADNMAIWALKTRENHRLHWDGMNNSLREVLLSSALGDGASLKSIELDKLKVLEDWLWNFEPPKFPGAVDAALLAQGQSVFSRVCADCHGAGGKLTGSVIPLSEVGTDGQRHSLWSQQAADGYNRYADGYQFDFSHWVATNGADGGYSSTPLTGIWLRAPYLHNGSVPALVDLLAEPYGDDLPNEVKSLSKTLAELPPRELRSMSQDLRRVEEHVKQARAQGRRPAIFFRGYDLVDFEHAGFVSDRANIGEEPQFFVFDTRIKGNSHGGHTGARYGTTLSAADKAALIEYLKTL
jgi:mono/diheme cytochrome c family protein